MKSFDRSIPRKSKIPYTEVLQRAEEYPETYIRARVVPWPEGAPDPSTVLQAGEQVTWRDGEVYSVVNGIPELSFGTWHLWIADPAGASQYADVDNLQVHVESPPAPRVYTEDEIRVAFEGRSYRYADTVIDALRKG